MIDGEVHCTHREFVERQVDRNHLYESDRECVGCLRVFERLESMLLVVCDACLFEVSMPATPERPSAERADW